MLKINKDFQKWVSPSNKTIEDKALRYMTVEEIKHVRAQSLNRAALLRMEIQALITKHAREGDMTWYQILGVAEIVKLDVLKMMEDAPT